MFINRKKCLQAFIATLLLFSGSEKDTGLSPANGYKITCPKLECMGNDPNNYHPDTNICFEHDGNVPTKKLIGQDCQYHQDRSLEFTDRVICDFDLATNKFAWVEETKQHLSGSSTYLPMKVDKDTNKQTGSLSQNQSPMKDKKTTALCRSYSALNNNKMPGRNCTSHDECYTMKCNNEKERKCEGRLDTHTCFTHADCDAPFFCNKDDKYPYVSTCKTLKTSYAPCEETHECLHTLYCWYADVKESPINDKTRNNKQCLPMYSQELGKTFGWYSENSDEKLAGTMPWAFEDFASNGRYCNTGLAFLLKGKKDPNDGNKQKYKSVCAAVEKITQGDKELKSPYECDPTDNEVPCVIYPKNILEDEGEVITEKFSVPCQCALDGQKGYCSSVIGTEEYKFASATQYLQREKSRCHTMDRDNYISWLDCSTESNMDKIKGAINWSFNITHWPYIHDASVKECIQALSRKSWKNIQALEASSLGAASFAVLLAGFALIN